MGKTFQKPIKGILRVNSFAMIVHVESRTTNDCKSLDNIRKLSLIVSVCGTKKIYVQWMSEKEEEVEFPEYKTTFK